jgi:cytochrome d ubiquinol oxidase subunit I
MQTRYYQTSDETYHLMTRFWGTLFLINTAIGVVSGIVNEFQFGRNWSGFSRFVGDIFGAPLALEAVLAFFAASSSIRVWVFVEGKCPEKIRLGVIWFVALGDLTGRREVWSLRVSYFLSFLACNDFDRKVSGHLIFSISCAKAGPKRQLFRF